MNVEDLDLYAFSDELDLEELPQGNALGSWFTAASGSSASCPFTSASCVSSSSTFG